MEIADLLSSLNEQDIEQLKQTASALLRGVSGGEDKPAHEDIEGGGHAGGSGGSFFDSLAGGLDAGLIKTLTGLGGTLNSSDPRCDFLLALKPLLAEERRERAEQAAKMLRLMKALPILKESNILKGFWLGLYSDKAASWQNSHVDTRLQVPAYPLLRFLDESAALSRGDR